MEEGDEGTLQQLQGHLITYRIAMGPHMGRKVLTLRTIPAREEEEYVAAFRVALDENENVNEDTDKSG